MSAVIQAEKELPQPVARRNISEAQWRTLVNSLYPGAESTSVLMAWDYCVARQLDPMKKPCHIVPMKVRDSKSGDYVWREVIMPGIYEYRTTAMRTGLYLGQSEAEFGPEIEYLGVKAPEWCKVKVFRWNKEAQQVGEFHARVKFSECVATTWDKKTQKEGVNARWTKAPEQMLEKCTEAAALRKAFPDELGGTHTADEMVGQDIEPVVVHSTVSNRLGFDTSMVDNDQVLEHFSTIVDLLNQDKDEYDIAEDLRAHHNQHLERFPEMLSVVLDKLKRDGVLKSKAEYRQYLNKVRGQTRGETHTA